MVAEKPQKRLLDFDGRHSARARSLGVILCGSELGLSVSRFGGQLIERARAAPLVRRK